MAFALFRNESYQRINFPIRTNTQAFRPVQAVHFHAEGFPSPWNPTRAIRVWVEVLVGGERVTGSLRAINAKVGPMPVRCAAGGPPRRSRDRPRRRQAPLRSGRQAGDVGTHRRVGGLLQPGALLLAHRDEMLAASFISAEPLLGPLEVAWVRRPANRRSARRS
jgi:hypothetical protein